MKILNIDIETFSSVDLAKCGVYKYVEATDFEILLFGFSVDRGPVQVIDLANGETIPAGIIAALTDESVTKWAFNANFERICISQFLKKQGLLIRKGYKDYDDTLNYLNPKSWKCTRVWSAYTGLPLSLEGAGAVLGLNKQKMVGGKNLIKFFCQPCSPTKTNGGRTRNFPNHAPDKWSAFKNYNARDVEVEISIQEKLAKFPVPDFVWDEYFLDQEINDRGVSIDTEFVHQAIVMDDRSRAELTGSIKALTDIENPNSVQQIKKWLTDNGFQVSSLDKKGVAELLKNVPTDIHKVLSLRQKISKTSVKKYLAMENAVCADGRARGMFQFYGATRTGRWAGRLIQMQNLPQNHLPKLEEARELVRNGDYKCLTQKYDSIPNVLSQLIRTAFIPKDGYKFIVADFSAIEARVLAWLADEKWRKKVFENNGDIYCASASKMFSVHVEKRGANSHLRQKGKIAELALGYGGSVGALKAMGALEMGLNENELQTLVTTWRNANYNIVKLWWDVNAAAINTVKYHITNRVKGLKFSYKSGMLLINLPSGRTLTYIKPRIETSQFGNECVTYEGIDSSKKWNRLETYGPKLVENIVQAISRDILCFAMKTLSNHLITMHVHDELVIEADANTNVGFVCSQMCITPPWCVGLKLHADGYETKFYKKD